MDVITYALAKKMGGGGGGSITYTLTADTENKTIVLTPSRGTAQVITVPYATDASTVNGHEVPELENGKIPANYLPSFVDNVDEYDSISLFPVVGESNRIYIDKSTNKTYRWSGTAYVEISESIALGETSSTAYRGDRGKIAYDHSQSAHAPSNAEANQNAFSNVKIDSDIINAGTTTDTLEFIAGDNIILTPNVSNKKITVSQVPVRKTASGDIASFSDGTGDPFLEVKVNIVPVQSGSGDPSPSNVRPISGWDSVNVTRTGKNLFDENFSDWKSIESYSVLVDKLPSNTLMNMSFTDNDTSVDISSIYLGFVNNYTGGAPTTYKWIINHGTVGTDKTNNVNGILCNQLFIYPKTEGTLNLVKQRFNVQVELGSTASTYEPYNGQTYTINLDGTRYGGTLDVVSGVLTVDRAYVDLGTLTWANPITNIFNVAIPDMSIEVKNKIMCSLYPLETTSFNWESVASYNDQSISTTGNNYIYVKDSRYSSASDFKTAMNGVQLVYELATPQTYQLTPTQVTTLLGRNNIFANCGQIEVAYKTPFYTDLTTKNEVQALINESITSALNASY